MITQKCEECGAEFESVKPRRFCCKNCNKRYIRKHPGQQRAWVRQIDVLDPPTFAAISRAGKKPQEVSDIRWRIELRRRANPDRYALAWDTSTKGPFRYDE